MKYILVLRALVAILLIAHLSGCRPNVNKKTLCENVYLIKSEDLDNIFYVVTKDSGAPGGVFEGAVFSLSWNKDHICAEVLPLVNTGERVFMHYDVKKKHVEIIDRGKINMFVSEELRSASVIWK